MKPVHGLFNNSLSTKQRLLEKRDNLKCDIDAAFLTATLYVIKVFKRYTFLKAVKAMYYEQPSSNTIVDGLAQITYRQI